MHGAEQAAQPDVVRTLIGLVVLLALAWLAGHPMLRRFEERGQVNPLIVTGLVFVFLGTLAAQRQVGVLTGTVLDAIAPIIPLALGWIGFRIGFDFDQKLIATPPPAPSILLAIIFPILFTLAGCAGLVYLVNPSGLADPALWRDILIGGVAAAMTSNVSLRALALRRPDLLSAPRLQQFCELEQAIGVIGLMFISMYFRPQGDVVGWQLPPVAWLFVTLGLGTAMGALTYGLFRTSPKGPPFVVILLGAICMTAGMASFLRLSVVSVCFVAGLVVTGLPGEWKTLLQGVMERMGRPVVFILLVVAGALWSPLDWRGWAVMAVLVAARLAGKSLGLWAADRTGQAGLTPEERRALVLSPVGVFAIAIILSARDLYPGARIPVMLTAAISASLLTEMLLQFLYPRLPRRA